MNLSKNLGKLLSMWFKLCVCAENDNMITLGNMKKNYLSAFSCWSPNFIWNRWINVLKIVQKHSNQPTSIQYGHRTLNSGNRIFIPQDCNAWVKWLSNFANILIRDELKPRINIQTKEKWANWKMSEFVEFGNDKFP